MGACMAAQCGPWADLEVNALRDISIISNQSFVRKRAPQGLKNPRVEADAGPMGFLAQEFLQIDSWNWDYEGDRRSLVTLNPSGTSWTIWLQWIEFPDR